ncbi:MAG: phosphatidylserine decarboxylase [Myxococcales bacterium]|nr:phosphatidylserine decarboxylase [Myxococcales bacterium]
MSTGTKLFLDVISRNPLSRTVGRIAGTSYPKPVLRAAISLYCKAYGVNVDEARLKVSDFNTFNEFFTRELADGLRPIDVDANVVVSPVDGVLLNYGKIGASIEQIKGKTYSVADLLMDKKEAARLQGGTYATIYLSPRHYHRIHCPDDGEIVGYTYVPGRLYPVNNLGLPNVDKIFAVNERISTTIKSKRFGTIHVVKVGATSVGSISVSYDNMRTNVAGMSSAQVRYGHPKPIGRGQELGRFNLGSTVVLLIENTNLSLCAGCQPNGEIQMGQRLFNLPPQ